MDWITEAVAVLLAGLSLTLATIGAVAAARYSDRRLALVAGGLAVIGVIGILGVLHQISPLYGEGFEISLVPLLLLLLAVTLLYVAAVAGRSRPKPAR